MLRGVGSQSALSSRAPHAPPLPCVGHPERAISQARCQHAEPCSAPSLAHRLVLVVLEEADVLERSLRLAVHLRQPRELLEVVASVESVEKEVEAARGVRVGDGGRTRGALAKRAAKHAICPEEGERASDLVRHHAQRRLVASGGPRRLGGYVRVSLGAVLVVEHRHGELDGERARNHREAGPGHRALLVESAASHRVGRSDDVVAKVAAEPRPRRRRRRRRRRLRRRCLLIPSWQPACA
mmetsp:Transcript_1634/g.5375  ORF Transcript_1634/g.5375 Transcript_1634/m.5375 type:complete len:240 (+) Transcript_1634:335-1054(+)